MKLELELPDWCDDRAIHVLAGTVEHVAKREFGVWYIKDERCNWCGLCCMNVPENWPHGYNPDNGHCKQLVQEGPTKWRCFTDIGIPTVCAVSEGEEDECNITWRRQVE